MLEKHVRSIYDYVKQQNEWRQKTINLIASENVVSITVRKLSGSDFAHRYAEGHPVKDTTREQNISIKLKVICEMISKLSSGVLRRM